ncbi:MAG: hypothetical protein ACKODH_11460 [Limisphaerales bacterium]
MKLATVLALLCAPLCIAAPKPVIPEIPEILKSAKANVSNRADLGGLTLSLSSPTPLTDEQWSAIESLKVRAFIFSGKAGDDPAMSRVVKLDPTALQFFGSPMTDAGAAHIAEMKSLKTLMMSHADRLTAAAATALANHPSVEVFATDGRFAAQGMAQIATAKKLRDVMLQHTVCSDANIALLARHPSLEKIRLWPNGNYGVLTDAALPSLATLPKLKELTLEFSIFTYAGGLKHLKDIPTLTKLTLGEVAVSDEDLAQLKADLPNVTITHTPMKPEYRAKWDQAMATKAKKK